MNKFDKNIKEKLHDAELPVSGGLWESIEAQILVQKEPSKLWFLFLLAAFTLPLLLLNHMGEKNKQLQNESIASVSINEAEKTESSQDIQQNIVVENNRAGIEVKETNTASASYDQVIIVPVKYTVDNSESPDKTIRGDMAFANTEPINAESINIESTHVEEIIHMSTPTTSNNFVARNISDNILPLSHIIKPVKKSETFLDLGFKRHYVARECPTFAGFNPGLYVYGEVGLGQSSHNLKPKNQEFGDYIDVREATEKGALSYSTTLGIGYQFQNGMIAESGLSYENLRLKFDSQGSSSLKNITVVVINTEITEMDTIITKDTLSVYNSGIVDIRPYNSFRQLDLPFVIGYEFPLSSKLRMSLKGGILINLVSMSKGQIVGQDDYPAHFGKGNDNDVELYKNNIGFSYTGGLNLEADLAPNITMYAGANVKYFPNSFSLASNPINQRFYRLGLTTGIKYRI